MRVLAELWRGTLAILGYLFGFPFVARRVMQAASVSEARRLIQQHGQRALDRSGIRLEVRGKLPPDGRGVVLVYNESSLADSFAYSAGLSTLIDRGASAEVWAKLPYMRAAFSRLGVAVVPRGDRAGTDRVLDEMVAAVKSGQRLAWGGEGRLSGIDGVLRFKVGAALIAIRAQAPIIPVAFRGAHALFPLGSLRARPGVITFQLGEEIPTAGLDESAARELSDKVQARVAALHAALPSGRSP